MEKQVENEFRFGHVTDGSFSSSVPLPMYRYLMDRAERLGARFTDAVTYEVVYYDNDVRLVNGVYQTKQQTFRKDFFLGPFAIRYSQSEEVTHPELEPPHGGRVHRKSRRTARLTPDIHFDFSEVDNGSVYQVEVEVVSTDGADVDRLFQKLCRWDYLPSSIPMVPLSIPEHQRIIYAHNERFAFRCRQPFYRVPTPVDLPYPLPNLGTHYVTYKYNGVRGMLGYAGDQTYFVNAQGLVVLDMGDSLRGCLLDVEAWDGSFVILDALFVQGSDVRSCTLEERLERVRSVSLPDTVRMLEVAALTRQAVMSMWLQVLEEPQRYDGLMVRAKFGRYREGEAYKVKPLDRLTVDLYVGADGLYAWSKERRELVRLATREAVRGEVEEGCIWEFQMASPSVYVADRIRRDRTMPNSVETIDRVVETARNPSLYNALVSSLPL